MKTLTAFSIQLRMVPDNAAAIPNRPLFKMYIATLNPSPTPKYATNIVQLTDSITLLILQLFGQSI